MTWTACKYGERPTSCPGSLPGFSSSTSTRAAGKAGVEAALMARDGGLQPLQAVGLLLLGNLIVHLGGGRAGPRRVHEGIGAGKADFVDERERVAEIGFGLAGKADDEVGGESEIGTRRRADAQSMSR